MSSPKHQHQESPSLRPFDSIRDRRRSINSPPPAPFNYPQSIPLPRAGHNVQPTPAPFNHLPTNTGAGRTQGRNHPRGRELLNSSGGFIGEQKVSQSTARGRDLLNSSGDIIGKQKVAQSTARGRDLLNSSGDIIGKQKVAQSTVQGSELLNSSGDLIGKNKLIMEAKNGKKRRHSSATPVEKKLLSSRFNGVYVQIAEHKNDPTMKLKYQPTGGGQASKHQERLGPLCPNCPPRHMDVADIYIQNTKKETKYTYTYVCPLCGFRQNAPPKEC